MYFVHSYAPSAGPDSIATCDYGGTVHVALARGAVAAVQFHPEKSSRAGLDLLANFVRIAARRAEANA
jgi:glutamine amidotransferase